MVMIRHSNAGLKARRARSLFMKFMDVAEKGMESLVARGGKLASFDWEKVTDTSLLELRKILVGYLKDNTYGRKDVEGEIAAVAMLVWFQRLEQDRRDQITDAWD